MLVRFRQDVLSLKPTAVVILAGTNDLAQNTGPETLEQIEGYFKSMCELARENHIHVVLASVLPVLDYDWRPGLKPAAKVSKLNEWLQNYARANNFVYLDYYSSLVDEQKGLKKSFSADGVHPNAAGYAVMTPLAEKAIAEALR